MTTTVTVLASGLKLLSFQGLATFQGGIIVATRQADLVYVAPDGTLKTWVSVVSHGIPTGIVRLQETLIVALSGQESGHFLIRVTAQGNILPLADLSALAGEFGAPFAVAAHDGYYPYYLVAISTDVSGSAGLIARVTGSGKTTVLATLANTPFGVGIGEDYAIATQENGQILRITFTGNISPIANLAQSQFGIPLDITRFKEDWIMTTSKGWLVALKPDGTLSPVINIGEIGNGLPTTLTTFGNQGDQIVVATQTGNVLSVML